jgi:hypothetical protein
MEEKEIWKDVSGYEGLYQVSNLGRVRGLPKVTKFGVRIKKFPLRYLKPAVSKRGYYIVGLSDRERTSTKNIHRLVAEAFIPNPSNLPCIDHIDTNKTNNVVMFNSDGSIDFARTNLRWCTHKGNSENPLTRLHQSQATTKLWKDGVFANRNNLHYRKVAQYTKDGDLVKVWDSIIEASVELGIDGSSITCVCKKRNPKRHTAGGYKWEYIGEYYRK